MTGKLALAYFFATIIGLALGVIGAALDHPVLVEVGIYSAVGLLVVIVASCAVLFLSIIGEAAWELLRRG